MSIMTFRQDTNGRSSCKHRNPYTHQDTTKWCSFPFTKAKAHIKREMRQESEKAYLVDVLLVHLVGHQHNVLIMCELDDIFQVVIGQALPSGVACRHNTATELSKNTGKRPLTHHLTSKWQTASAKATWNDRLKKGKALLLQWCTSQAAYLESAMM